jgi:hypothetical protein
MHGHAQSRLICLRSCMVWLLFYIQVLMGGHVFAAEVVPGPLIFYVNNITGKDSHDGRQSSPVSDGNSGPVATITRAIELAPPSSRILIANTGLDYRETVRVGKDKHGKPDAPFVIDGQGATVNGLLQAPAKAWTHLRDDIYWFEHIDATGKRRPMPKSNWLAFLKHQGWFQGRQAPEIFFLNGKTAPHVRSLEELQPGAFFYDTQTGPLRLYFRLPANAKLEDLTLELPLNEGVFIDSDYVVVRNLQSKYSQADGFAGYWGYGVVFENINGSFNCDQGFSMHGNSITLVDGALFERNGGCGIVDVHSCVSVFRNIIVRDNMIAGALFQGSYHNVRSSWFTGNAGPQIGGNTVDLENCLISDGYQGVNVRQAKILRTTFAGCREAIRFENAGTVEQSLLMNNPVQMVILPAAVGQVRLIESHWSSGSLQWGDEKVAAASLASFLESRDPVRIKGNTLGEVEAGPPWYRSQSKLNPPRGSIFDPVRLGYRATP